MSKDAIDEFQAFLDERLGRLEQAAAIAAAEIEMETRRSDLAGAIAARAERFSRMRAELDVDGAGGPSEGLELMIRQLAVAGAAPDEIERRLAHLGIEHSREAVGQIFRVGQH
jgi:hypothetical protein